MSLPPEETESLFTRSDGTYLCARWGRPIAPVVFGVTEETLPVIKGAFEALCQLAGHQMAETDPELGSNLMVFFARDWDEVAEVPHLQRIDEVAENDWQVVPAGQLGEGPFPAAVRDFYLTNPIARASELMAELSRLAQERAAAPMAAE